MRMTIDKLITQEVDDINNIKMLFFLPYLGIEDHMKKHIAKFFGQLTFLTLQDGIAQLIYLLNGLRPQRFVCLLSVPRTFLT